MMRRPRYREPSLLENALACLGYVVLVALIVAVVVMTFLFAGGSSFGGERQIRRDCSVNAIRYCPKDAWTCLKKETPECRLAVINCMLANKDRLSAACLRHFW